MKRRAADSRGCAGPAQGARTDKLALLAVLLAGACRPGIVDTGFTPYSSTSVGSPLVARAVVAYQGDMPGFESLGSVLVGTVSVQAEQSTPVQEVEAKAGELAAGYGGTHIVLAGTRQTQTIGGGGGHTPVSTTFWLQYDFTVIQVPPAR